MKRAIQFFKRNFWLLLLDVIVVNASYYAALLIRFFVHNKFDEAVLNFLPPFYRFAPFYTVLCVIIFYLFNLYNGMWRYAGLNDLNRVILANVCTAFLYVAGTVLFVQRMPITYYVIGAVLQFLFMAVSRFVCRFYLKEKNKIAVRKTPSKNVMIIGANELGRRVVRNLLDNTSWRAVCFLDRKENEKGKVFDGIPVFELEDLTQKLCEFFDIDTILITDGALTDGQREEIKAKCGGIELIDFTDRVNGNGGAVALTGLLNIARGPVTVSIADEKKEYANAEEAARDLQEAYSVAGVSAENGALYIRLEKPGDRLSSGFDEWAKKYKEETGEDVSFF